MKHQKKAAPEQWREVRLAVISYTELGVACSCGWTYGLCRERVLENAIDRHLNKRHHGRGIRT